MDGSSVFELSSGNIMFLLLGTAATVICQVFVTLRVPSPYMDELFHVDQIQQYCKFDFSYWNNKITTPPGLYVFSTALMLPVRPFLPPHVACGTMLLRLSNSLYFIGINIALACTLQQQRQSWKLRYLESLSISLLPVLYFFNFLYYTDMVSTLLVLSMYYHHLVSNRRLSAWFGFLSITVRQTNVVWVTFCLALEVDGYVRNLYQDNQIDEEGLDELDDPEDRETPNDILYRYTDFLTVLYEEPLRFVGIAAQMIRLSFGHVLTLCLFTLFVFWNGSIVLGDKTAHQACFHVPQLFYFAVFTVVFGFPHFARKNIIRSVSESIVRKPYRAVMLLALILLCIFRYTHEHLYLLSDNRHYTFYVWRKWFKRAFWAKYILAPVYLAALLAIFFSLQRVRLTWKLGYLIAVALTTVPNKLLEFRYFILPFLIWRLAVPKLAKKWILFEIMMFSAINTVTLYLFLLRPFLWSDGSLQRFMW